MYAEDLIRVLQELPPHAEVHYIFDGFCVTPIELVWLSQGGRIICNDGEPYVQYDLDRPEYAPSVKENHDWPGDK